MNYLSIHVCSESYWGFYRSHFGEPMFQLGRLVVMFVMPKKNRKPV